MSKYVKSGDVSTIYLDHAATTPIREEVFAVMQPVLESTYGNPSSIHHKGREAFDTLMKARRKVACALGAHESEIIFTGSGTEANNLALIGTMQAQKSARKHLLVSSIEHTSVLASAEVLRKNGYEVEYIPVDEYGHVSVKDIMARIRKETALISLMYANNEIGTIEPITEIAHALRNSISGDRPLLHTDACQAPGQLSLDVETLGVDLMTINGSKMYGPKGVGMLYVRSGTILDPHIVGGGQEHRLRAGTENIAGIVGFAHALTLAVEEQEAVGTRLTTMRNDFISEIQKNIPDVVLNGHPRERLPGNIHFSFPAIEGEALVLLLDSYGICTSTGSACNAEDLLPSHVLRATRRAEEHLHGSLRITLGRDTTASELTVTLKALIACVMRLRSLSPIPLHL